MGTLPKMEVLFVCLSLGFSRVAANTALAIYLTSVWIIDVEEDDMQYVDCVIY